MTRPRPLAGLKVLDFTRVFSGPLATLWLSDLGAEVVKVEHPAGGDDSRTFGPFIGNTSGYFETLNRGKRSIAVDYRHAAGQRLLARLAQQADVLVENFRPGQMDKYGLGYETLKLTCPRLIYASISGFGRGAPWANRGCYDIVAQAESGLMALTGLPELPCKTGPAIADAFSGMAAAVGLLAALWGRERSGLGAHIDVAMVDTLFACLENTLAAYSITGEIPARQGNRDHVLAPFDSFAVSDGWVVVGVGNDRIWRRLALLVGDGLENDARFAGNDRRVAHYPTLRPIIERWFEGHSQQSALDSLHLAGVPAGAVRTIDELATDERLEARGMLMRLALEGGETVLAPGAPIHIAGTEPTRAIRAPQLGEHTSLVLDEWLGG